MNGQDRLKIFAHSERAIVMERAFHAPRHLVFDAWTKPELLKRWLGVFNGWTLAVCEVDLRIGGSYRFVWQRDTGTVMGMGGVYSEVDAPKRFVSTEKFDMAWYPGEAISEVVLKEPAGLTTVTNTISYNSAETRDAVLKSPMETGVAASYDLLAQILAE